MSIRIYFLGLSLFFAVFSISAQNSGYKSYQQIANFEFSRVLDIDWSPDGKQLAVVSYPNIYLSDADTWEIKLLIPDAQVSQVDWKSDGTQLASVQGGKNEKLIVWNSLTGEELNRIIRPNDFNSNVLRIFQLSWSPDGSKIVSDSTSPDMLLWDLSGKASVSVFATHGNNVIGEVDWSPDSTRIVSGGGDGTIRIWDALDMEQELILEGGGLVDWHPTDDKVLGHGDFANTSFFAFVWDANTGKELLHVKHGASILSVRWNADGSMIATGGLDGIVKIWDVKSTELIAEIQAHEDLITALVWHPQLNMLATSSLDGQIYVWAIQN